MTISSIVNFFHHIILTLDFLGPRPELNINKQPRYHTLLGAILTSLALAFSVLTVRFSISNFFSKRNPDIFTTYDYSDNPIMLNTSNFPFYLTVLTLNQSDYSLIPINKSEIIMPYILNMIKNSSGYYTDYIGQMQDCSEGLFNDYNSGLVSNKKYTQEEIELFRSTSLCLPPNVTRPITNEVISYSYLQMGFLYEPYYKLIEKYKFLLVRITYKSILLFPNDFSNPYRKIWTQKEYYIDENKMLLYQVSLESMTIIKDQTTFIFQDILENTELNVNKVFLFDSMIQKHIAGYDLISVISIGRELLNTSVMIRYTSLDSIISGFGGSFDVFRNLFEIFVFMIVKYSMYPFMMNRLLDFHINRNQFNYKEVLEAFRTGDIDKLVKYKNIESKSDFNFAINEKKFKAEDKIKTPICQVMNLSDPSIKSHFQISNNASIFDNKSNLPEIKNKGNFSLKKLSQPENNYFLKNEVEYIDLPAKEIHNTINKNKIIELDLKNINRDAINPERPSNLIELIPNKKVTFISNKDFVRAKCSTCFKKSSRNKIILYSEELLENFSDINKIIKNELDFEILSDTILESKDRQILFSPSFNLEDNDVAQYLENLVIQTKFNRKYINGADQEIFVNRNEKNHNVSNCRENDVIKINLNKNHDRYEQKIIENLLRSNF
jgi:hypothetical protein